jgi:hypothetical protein
MITILVVVLALALVVFATTMLYSARRLSQPEGLVYNGEADLD